MNRYNLGPPQVDRNSSNNQTRLSKGKLKFSQNSGQYCKTKAHGTLRGAGWSESIRGCCTEKAQWE